ncbi:hypothetical protein KY386_01465 [Candidatus Parcubacteria bacterium]|nr:hypothetical protein [Candidatus Parcubacteria bacterium]
MGKRLKSYSIESDGTVILKLHDGSSHRASEDQLAQYLSGPDLTKVLRAVRLRRKFINTLPPWVKVLVPITAMMMLVATTTQVAGVFQRRPHQPVPPPTSAAQAVPAQPPATLPQGSGQGSPNHGAALSRGNAAAPRPAAPASNQKKAPPPSSRQPLVEGRLNIPGGSQSPETIKLKLRLPGL